MVPPKNSEYTPTQNSLPSLCSLPEGPALQGCYKGVARMLQRCCRTALFGSLVGCGGGGGGGDGSGM
jgi:hypothetical protein